MICAQYPPENGPGPTRMIAFARGLREHGFEPVVFASDLGSDTMVARWRVIDNPTEPRGVPGRTLRGRRQSRLQKGLNLFVPMEPPRTLSLWRLRRLFKKSFHRNPPAAIFTTSNPLASAVAGMMLKRYAGVPLITEFRDPWIDNLLRSWPTKLHFLVESWLERSVLREADAVIMNTPQARLNLLARQSWRDPETVHVISHGFDGAPMPPRARTGVMETPTTGRGVTIAYAGGFYSIESSSPAGAPYRVGAAGRLFRRMLRHSSTLVTPDQASSSPTTVLKAIAKLNRKQARSDLTFRMVFIGLSRDIIFSTIEELGVGDYVSFRNQVSPFKLRPMLNEFDLLFLVNPGLSHSPFVSSKTADYLAAGVPILAELPEGAQAEIVRRTGGGWVCAPHDVEGMARTLETLAANDLARLRDWRPDLGAVALMHRSKQVCELTRIVQQALGEEEPCCVISPIYRLHSAEEGGLVA